jgi:hypothetical protein
MRTHVRIADIEQSAEPSAFVQFSRMPMLIPPWPLVVRLASGVNVEAAGRISTASTNDVILVHLNGYQPNPRMEQSFERAVTDPVKSAADQWRLAYKRQVEIELVMWGAFIASHRSAAVWKKRRQTHQRKQVRQALGPFM